MLKITRKNYMLKITRKKLHVKHYMLNITC
jgi:hypothetical protein